jgi:S-layer homology domain
MKRVILTVLATTMLLAPVAQALDIPFSDHLGHRWESGIEFVYNRGIVQGYDDGTYKPDKTLNRAELLKVVVTSSFDEWSYDYYDSESCFDDVEPNQWYTQYVCFAKAQGIVQGYDDGTFRPGQEVNFVEALKIMFKGMDVQLTSSDEDPWYQMYYDTAASKYLIPYELRNQYHNDFSRAQAAEVLMRILSLDADISQPPFYQDEGGYEPGTVYLGYLQEGNVLDLYLVADSSVANYSTSQIVYTIVNNTVVDFRPDYLSSDFTSNTVTVSGTISLAAGEVVHVGTAYLDSSSAASVTTQ